MHTLNKIKIFALSAVLAGPAPQSTLGQTKEALNTWSAFLTQIREMGDFENRNNPVYHYFKGKKLRQEELLKTFADYPLQMKNSKDFRDSTELDSLITTTGEPYILRKQKSLPIYYFGFSDNFIQGLAFDRISVFVEVESGRLASDSELFEIFSRLEEAGGGGHDYRVQDIALFFNAAEKAGITLNPVEKRIHDELLASALIKKDSGKYIATQNAAIISTVASLPTISNPLEALVSKDVRIAIHHSDNAHEFNHGVYFTDEKYRAAANQLWSSLSAQEKKAAQDLMSFSSLYDFQHDQDLLIREFIAYFRDPEELKSSYLNPIGSDVKDAKEGSPLFRLQPFYDKTGILTPETLQQIKELSEKVKSIDSKSSAYLSAPHAKIEGNTSGSVSHLFPLLDSIFRPGRANAYYGYCVTSH